MTVPGDGCPDSAMRIQISELFPSLEDAPAVEVVLKILAEAGLVRLVRHMVEPSSVSLVQKWPTLRKWLEEDRDGLRLLYQLAEHTRQWTRSRKSNECLLSGARLMEIEEWLKTNPGVTNTHERDFLSASRQKAEQTHIEVEPRLRSELEDSRRVLETEHQRAESYRMQADAEHQRSESLVSSIVRWRIITWGMAIGIILVVVASLISFSAWSTMNQQLESQASAAWIRLTQAAQGIWQAETAQVASTRALIDRATALAETTRIAVQRENALSQSKDFLSYLLAAQASKILASQPDAGLLLAIEANQLKDNRETRSSLIESLQALPYIAHILNGQISDINSVAFSPDGRLVASGAENGDIRIWLAGSGLTVGEMLNSRSGAVNDVAFSPDGKFLASVTGDRNVYIWNLDTKEANILPINDMISSTSISYNPDGKLLAVGGESRNNVAFLLDPNTGKQVGATLVGHTARVQSIVFSPDGQFLASAGWDRTVIIWDKNTQRPILPPFQGPEDRLTKVAFHPEGNIMAASSASRIIYLWNVFTGREIYRLKDGHSNIITGISFSSDGNTLASSSLDGTIQLWNMVNRQKRDQPLKGHVGEVYSVAFHPNGVQLASGGQDQKTMVWDLRADQQLNRNIINGSDIKKAAISPDGRIVAQIDCARFEGSVCLQDEARFWLVSPGSAVLLPGRQPLRDFRQMYGIQFSPDGSIVAVAGCQSEGPVSAPCYQHGVRLYLTLSGQQIGVPLEGHTDTITTMAFSKDGRILATGSRDRSIRIWDGTSGTFSRIVLRSHTGAISALEFSVDGRRMVSAGLDRTIRLWDTSTWLPASQPLRGNNDSIYSLVYTPDGKFFYSGGADRLIVQWDSLTLTPTQSFSTSHTSAISNLAFSPDRSTLYSTGNDRTLRFWDIIDQREIGQAMSGHEGPIHSLNITRDGEILMTASRDRIRVWELNPKAWQAKACQVAGRNLSLKDWSTFIPGEAYRKTCSIWPEGK
jgi:WD40 repeat protein